MDNQLCPKCDAVLEGDNIILTKESAIFKGHNVYMLCKHCGYVMVYNKDRNLIFNIDKYQDDKEVLLEIEQLISQVDSHYTLDLDEQSVCNGNCSGCSQCEHIEESNEEDNMDNVKEEVVQEEQQFSIEAVYGSYLLINNENGQAHLLKLEDFQMVPDLQNYSVFALEEVMVEPVVTFKVHKK